MIDDINNVRRAINGQHNHSRLAGEIVANANASLDRIEDLVRSLGEFEARWSASADPRTDIGSPTEVKPVVDKATLLHILGKQE